MESLVLINTVIVGGHHAIRLVKTGGHSITILVDR
jgi:hypothetical protein